MSPFPLKIQKNAAPVFVLIALSVIFLWPMFQKNFYLSHDGEAHVARFAAYFTAFKDGQIPPRWAGNLNSGYGSPLFIFFYPLPGYIASLFHVFGISFETIYKIIMSLSFILAPVFFFYWLREKANKEIAFITAAAYLMLPYRFLDTFVRGDIAEMVSFLFMPLTFLFIDKLNKRFSLPTFLFPGFFYCFFILAHNAIAFILTPVFFLYILVFSKNSKTILFSVGSLLFGVALSAFFWIPAIFETKYVYSDLLVVNVYKTNFISLLHLIYAPWGFGPDVEVSGGQSPQIGIMYTGIALLSLLVIIMRKRKKEMLFWLLIFFISAFMTTAYSRIFWEKLPVIKLMGYPWRFTSLSGFASCMLLFCLLQTLGKKLNNILMIILVVFFVICSFPFDRVKSYVAAKPDAFYYSYQGTTDYHMRTTTKWVAGDFWQKANSQASIIAGKGKVTPQLIKSNKHIFHISAFTHTAVVDNTVYFPGWRVTVDGKRVPIEFQDQHYRGLITFQVPQGTHIIESSFFESPIRLASDIISLVSGVIFISLLFMQKQLRRYL